MFQHRVADAADVAIKTRLSSPPASRATIGLARGRLRVLAVARTIPDCCPARQARGSDDNRNRTQSLRPLRHLIYPFTTRWMGMVSVSVTRARLSDRAPLYPYYSAASAGSCSRRPMRLVRAGGALVCIASPRRGRSPCLSGPCQCPFPDGGPAHSGHSQDIGVDFALRFGFAQNNSKNIAGCDTRTSHPAIAGHRKVRHDNIAPCDSLTSHPATSRYLTLPLSPVAPCDSKSQLSTP